MRTRNTTSGGRTTWKIVRKFRFRRSRCKEESYDFRPIYPGPTEDTYFVAGRPDGHDTSGIHLYNYATNTLEKTVKEVAGVDIYNAFFDHETGVFEGVHYYDAQRLVLDLRDKKLMSHFNGLAKYFGAGSDLYPLQKSKDGGRWLLYVEGPKDSGSYHLYDVATAHVREFAIRRPRLARQSLAPMQVVEYKARDGLSLTGYFTQPVTMVPGKNSPLIMLPHGGPEVRDIAEFNDDAQVLAAYGYQVFQPNFRGSSGFGKAFAERGFGEWGRKMQTDLEDGLQHLVQQGLADAERSCIVGASYGGYAALTAVAKPQQPYRCAIAVAPVTDLVTQLKFDRKEEGARSEAYLYLVTQMGDPRTDEAEMVRYSPAQNAKAINVPVLLLHGEEDSIVPISQSELMARRLAQAGKVYEFQRVPGADHSFARPSDEKRYYREILGFLEKHLPIDQEEEEQNSKE